MATNLSTSTLRITESFVDYGFWVQYQSALNVDLNSEMCTHAELYIGESKLGGATIHFGHRAEIRQHCEGASYGIEM